MKRAIIFIIMVSVLLAVVPAYAAGVSIYINGENHKFNPAPIIENGTTLVPMRPFFEAMGAKVYWNDETRTVTGIKGDRVVQLTIGSSNGYVNGQAVPLSEAARIIDGYTFVPLRFIGESFDGNVNYNNDTQTITVNYREKSSEDLSTVEIARNQRAVGSIIGYNRNGEEISEGSGFLIDSSGSVVTNYHVIKGIDTAEFVLGEDRYKAGVVRYYDTKRDIAVLKVEGEDFPFVSLGDSDNVEVGEKVVAIGSPLGLDNTVSEGIVSAIRDGDIQFTAPVSFGSSGGALFNSRGEVIGITFATYLAGQNINFAIPINEVKDMIKGQAIDMTFDDLRREMSYEDFAQYLADNYSYANINDLDIWIDWFSVSESDEGNIIVLAAFDGSGVSYHNWLSALLNGHKTDISNWMGEILREVESQYPGKTVGGGVYYMDTFSTYPSAFKTEEIEKNEDGTYSVTHMAAFFTNVGGKDAVIIN